MKMYFLLKMGIFQCHVSLREVITSNSPHKCMMAARFIDSTPAVCAVAGTIAWTAILFGGNCVTPIFFIGWQDWPASSSHLCSQKMIHFEDVHIPPRKINVERSPKMVLCFEFEAFSGSLAVRFHDFHEHHTPEV